MDLGLQGRVAFVAGASRGLGYAVAHALVREGAQVAICARHAATLNEAAERLRAAGGEVQAVVADVTVEAEVERAIARTVEQFGALQVLVTNAGGAPSGDFDALTPEMWRQAWELNFLSHVHLIRAALPHLRSRGWGRIIALTDSSARKPT